MKHSRYARLPLDVLLDARLSARALRIYGILAAHAFQGSVAYIGQRFIGELVGCSAATAGRELKRLEEFGFVNRSECESGQRLHWVLTSSVFGKKQRAGVEEVVSAPSGGKRFASVRREEVA